MITYESKDPNELRWEELNMTIQELFEEFEGRAVNNWRAIGTTDEFIANRKRMQEIAQEVETLVKKEERQFILNVLDGIDIADKQMGNKTGGTKAIRHALKSRV